MELPWGGLEQQARRRAGTGWPSRFGPGTGTVIVSHEILATASPVQVRRALESFGADTDVHVVLSVRDLVRQVPAEWQENVKHRRTLGYREFLDKVTDPARRGTVASWFWGVQEVPAILDRWGATLPPEQVHVVTVPRPGAPPRAALGALRLGVRAGPRRPSTASEPTSNPSLGVAETALVRRINERVNDGVLANERLPRARPRAARAPDPLHPPRPRLG